MKINKTDIQLIKELQRNGISSYSELAEKIGITARTVRKRVERLLAEEIISIRAQPNPYKLKLFASALITIKTDLSKNEQICRKLAENFYVNLVQTVFGHSDILAIVYFPNLEKLHKFIDEELYTLNGVLKVEVYHISDTLKRYERFFQKNLLAKEQIKLKSTDWELIKALSRDARTNSSVLAKDSGIHMSTVYRRIEALLKYGAIRISAIPNPSRLTPGSANAYVILESEPVEINKIRDNLVHYPEVHFIMTMSNRSGIILCIHSKDNETLFRFIQENISYANGVVNTETFIRAMVHKTYYGWFDEQAIN